MNRERFEIHNSILWFVRGALWMLGLSFASGRMTVPTILTGLTRVAAPQSFGERLVNSSMFCWILMNSFWLLSEVQGWDQLLIACRVFGGAGIIFLILARFIGEDWERSFFHFRRLRIRKSS